MAAANDIVTHAINTTTTPVVGLLIIGSCPAGRKPSISAACYGVNSIVVDNGKRDMQE